MLPKKLYMFLGYNNLSLILEQERKHWLLKTDKKKQLQDKNTGDVFQGVVDNIGSDIILETEKLPVKNDIIQHISYANPSVSKILGFDNSAFTYSPTVNGLMFARILSTQFPMEMNGVVQYKHFKLKLKDCETCIIPFGGSLDTSEVFADRWLKTSTVPTILLLDDAGNYSIEKTLEFDTSITNPTFYYPLTESLQPLSLTNEGNGVYVTEAVIDNGFIGYPLYWFTCDQTNVGPTLSITNNTNNEGCQLMFVGSEGNASRYNVKLYVGIDGDCNATPDGSDTDYYKITCRCIEGKTFFNTSTDFSTPIDPSSISMEYRDQNSTISYPMGIICSEKDTITMSNNLPWVYVNETTYEIDMSIFDSNCINVSKSPMISTFDVQFDTSVHLPNTTSDTGSAGIRMSSSNIASDVYPKYPHELNKWDGLPDWIRNIDDGSVPQHMAIYAIHNTPTASPEVLDSRQVAALLLDPGVAKTNNDELVNENIGRVYVLSNDNTEYKNNAKEVYPKPARTVARICDIPTSVMQLSGISGIAPMSIVDKKYVRTEASFDEIDKDRLYNTLAERWVKPTAMDENGVPITNDNKQDNQFVFNSVTLLESVDMFEHNNFRYQTNLNPKVDPQKVKLSMITDPGKDYQEGNLGVVVVGGFTFNYHVKKVNADGGVLELDLIPEHDMMINLSNFDMRDGNSGITDEYGTSPSDGTIGSGLRICLLIQDYVELGTTYGEIFDDLFAFVKRNDGLWLYNYQIDNRSTHTPKSGVWGEVCCISQYENSSIYPDNGGLSVTESYINSIIPSLREVTVPPIEGATQYGLKVLKTATFVNVVDKTKTPIQKEIIESEPKQICVDLCKFYCAAPIRLKADRRDVSSVMDKLRERNMLHYDAYVFWNWENDKDAYFVAGVIERGFNNTMSTDTTTTLPNNALNCQSYINTNPATSIVWDVDDVGVMMWTYNPRYQKHETYHIDPSTNDLIIGKRDITWADVDVSQTTNNLNVNLIDSEGRLLYNIITNNPVQIKDVGKTGVDLGVISDNDPIYQQPNYTQFEILKAGTYVKDIPPAYQPMGTWQLVFPRIQTFTLSNELTGKEFVPIKLQTIKGSNIGAYANITDEYGRNVNTKSIVINETVEGLDLRIFNSETSTWEKIQ